MKLEKPEPFTGIPSKLQNFLFSVQLYSGVCGVTSSTEMVKVAVTFADGESSHLVEVSFIRAMGSPKNL